MSNTRAILLMTGAMASFALVDTTVKLAAKTQSPTQIVAVSSAMVFAIFLVWVHREGSHLFGPGWRNPVLWVRSVGEVIGSFGIVIALALAPLSTVTALGQAQPLAVTVGAALFLGETVGWRRWMAVGLGFLGVLIILRPGLGSFDPNLLWVLLYIFGLAARDLASRALPPDISTPFAVIWAMLPMIVVALLLMPLDGGWHPIDGITGVYYVVMIASTCVALWMLTTALRSGEVSAVAPFRYTRILFSLTIAFAIFNERLDFWAWVGAALIIGSGLYAFFRERQVAENAT